MLPSSGAHKKLLKTSLRASAGFRHSRSLEGQRWLATTANDLLAVYISGALPVTSMEILLRLLHTRHAPVVCIYNANLALYA